MNESITRAAGGVNGQEFDAAHIEALAASIGRPACQRTTLYKRVRSAKSRPGAPASAAGLVRVGRKIRGRPGALGRRD